MNKLLRYSIPSLLLAILLWLVFWVIQKPEPIPNIVIDAVIYDGFELANHDEAIVLMNLESKPIDLSGWQLTDNDSGTAVIPPNTLLDPQAILWITKDGFIFSNRYRQVADFELQDSHPMIDDLLGSWPGLTDIGDELILLNTSNHVVDALVYKAGDVAQAGWNGTAVHPTYIEEEGIFLRRQRDPNTNQPIDTNTASDWIQDVGYMVNGRLIGSPIRKGSNLTPKE